MKAIENVEALSVSSSELAAMHGSRAKIYSLLARLFRAEIDPLFLDQLKAMRLPAATGNEKMDAGYRKVARYLGQTDSSTLTELAVDYVRAFIGHGIDAHSAAYPFESVYTIAKRLMMQGARDEVMALYRSESMDKTTEFKEAEDHSALELEFMGVLAERSSAAMNKNDVAEADPLAKVQSTFVKDHLSNWTPFFARDMRLFAKTDLYLGLANLLEGFLLEDEALLDELASK